MGAVDNPLAPESGLEYQHILGNEIPEGTLCEKCQERPAEVIFYSNSTSVMDVVHGGVGKPYCKVCVTESQIAYEMQRSTILTKARNVLADMKGEGPRFMPLAEFRDFGYLQEINRLFLHPLGLAMEIYIDEETGEGGLTGIWDCRDDPEGIAYGPDMLDRDKALRVQQARLSFVKERDRLFGGTGTVQQLPGDDDDS